VSGALGVILREPVPNLEKSLLLRPFPQEVPPGADLVRFRTQYREGMIQQAGLCVFICGLKDGTGGGSAVIADGVIEEYESAKRLGRAVLPVGATGGASEVIWRQAKAAGARPAGLSGKDFDELNSSATTPAAVARIIGKAIAALDK
jgi:hypothetical protein